MPLFSVFLQAAGREVLIRASSPEEAREKAARQDRLLDGADWLEESAGLQGPDADEDEPDACDTDDDLDDDFDDYDD